MWQLEIFHTATRNTMEKVDNTTTHKSKTRSAITHTAAPAIKTQDR
jgi:hypothetical protein